MPRDRAAANTPPGTFGTAAWRVAATSLEVQNQQSGGQVTVNFTATTKFTNTVAVTLAGREGRLVRVGHVGVRRDAGEDADGDFGRHHQRRRQGLHRRRLRRRCRCWRRLRWAAKGAGGASRQPNPSRPRPSGANGPGGAGNFRPRVRVGLGAGQPRDRGFTVHGVARGSQPRHRRPWSP